MTAADQLAAIEARWKTALCLTKFPVSTEAAAKARGEVMGADVPAMLATIREQAAKLEAVRDCLLNLDAIEEVDPTTPTNLNVSAGGVASVIRDALGAGDE